MSARLEESEFAHLTYRARTPERQQAANERAAEEYPVREAALWQDLEAVSEAMQDLKCLSWRRKVRAVPGLPSYPGYPAIYTGTAALLALRNEDAILFMEIVRKEVAANIRQLAEDKVNEEYDV